MSIYESLTGSDGVVALLISRLLLRAPLRQREISRAERQRQKQENERYKKLLHAHSMDQSSPDRHYMALAPSHSLRSR